MRYTDEANFNDASEIMRAGMIASMVNENQRVFELSLVRAEDAFQRLSETLRLEDLANLQSENQKFSAEIIELRTRAAQDSSRLEGLVSDTARISRRLREDSSLTAFQRQQMQAQLQGHRSTIQTIERERSGALQRIGELQTALTQNQTQLSSANARLAELERDFQANSAELVAARNQVEQLGTNSAALRQALDTVTVRWKEANAQANTFRQQAEIEHQRAETLARRVDSLATVLVGLQRSSDGQVATNSQ
jgi:chromosome segregation ATPase